MFYLGYLRSELVRRKGRTILTVLGLAVGVSLVIAVSALSRGLDRAQATALDPLSSIGTDLTVTLAPQESQGGQGGFGGGGFGGGREVIQANQSVITDLSKLGEPGEKFVHDFFLPGTQLTFAQSSAAQAAKLPGVESVASGLVLAAVHQSGTVPEIVAKIKAGGQQLQIDQQIERPTAAEFEKMQACLAKAGIQFGGGQGGGAGGGAPNGGAGGLGGGQGGGRAGSGADRSAFNACLPERLRRFRTTVTTPEETLQQVVDPPQTDISSSTYTIAGVDLSTPGIGVVTPSLVSSGRFIKAGSGSHEALLAGAYASRKGLKVGSKLILNGTAFEIVGLVRPPLGGQTADVYIPLSRLQALAGQQGSVNVLLVRAKSGTSVGEAQRRIEALFPRAQVASAKQVADSISGSLVDAASLSKRLGTALAALAAVAAFLLAVVLTLSSVGKRVRELGTLKALGWTQRLVIRQVVGESVAQGVAGGLAGVVLGVLAAVAIGELGPKLTATSSTGGGEGFFGLGQVTARTVTDQVALTAPVSAGVLVTGFALAVAGGLLAGAAGAFRASQLRPADALRQVE